MGCGGGQVRTSVACSAALMRSWHSGSATWKMLLPMSTSSYCIMGQIGRQRGGEEESVEVEHHPSS